MEGAFRVGEWQVEPQLNLIADGIRTTHLEPKVMRVLVYLAEHAGEVNTKERLLHAVWPDTFVTDDVLTHAISELRRAFGDDARQPRFILTVPKGGYRLVAPLDRSSQAVVNGDAGSPPAAAQAPSRRRDWWLAVALAGALLLAVAVWLRSRPREIGLALPRLVPLTSTVGLKRNPTFSPDGGQIAFAWQGEKGDNWDIYIGLIGSSGTRRLTTDSALDVFPSWSPDGRQIAFIRTYQEGDAGTIRIVSPLGGSDRKLSDQSMAFGQVSWSPDSRWLAAARDRSAMDAEPGAAGIYLIPALGGEPRPVTSAKAPACHHDPALSPDGHHLAYTSCTYCGNFCLIDVVELSAEYVPSGPPRRLTHPSGWIRSLAWTRDGNSLIYGDFATGRLWRVWTVGDRPPERVEIAGLDAFQPATAAALDRLAFAHDRNTAAIYRFEVGHSPEVLLESSLGDWLPHFSPDARQITFQSRRGGEGAEVWLAAADGSNRMQLTHGPGIWQATPRWSPDGERIAFNSQAEDGKWDIWTIDPDGGSPHRLTLDPGNQTLPSWSRDSHWIYFQSDRAGAEGIWRIPATGGSEERVSRGGGSFFEGGFADESANGTTLFFPDPRGALLALQLPGGPERKVVECVPNFGFAVGPAGVYHLGCGHVREVPLYLLDPATGQDRLLATLEEPGYGLALSSDGKTILSARWKHEYTDLMMIENFR